ncbi:hypothetical protein L2E82_09884 [Cichorium intybus]|uniref:Uncharacterized protein n=1 Tax=Cichorium intybus TaxID=13427 RepID=A0ACB9GAC8_CICIN|nr:hypothetical protein L2E82_09884 [Cichorium intybus]
MNKQENYVASLVLFRSVTSNLRPTPPPPPIQPHQPSFPTSYYVLFVPFPSISVTLIIHFIPSNFQETCDLGFLEFQYPLSL